ncbi:DUF84 family protein [Falsibacillus albus]|uniref:Probable inosine/xanthosine triphosphatase n=1 Tax=Falsibacillus albus TaxID=2478915 RepID=A0A3L7K5G9_9BACI|nr:DUF84 family protein [Falsibacillus albus]RLQ97895.1 DUF84 family protein [Falsibacillus albus]
MIVSIGTKNPAKIKAVEHAFMEVLKNKTFLSFDVPSGVSEQPFSDEETIKGAVNRAEWAKERGKADIGIGLEGGVVKSDLGLFLCNWGALSDGTAAPIIAGGARILLPDEVGKRVLDGEELGHVMDDFCQAKDIRKSQGAVGIFSDGLVTRDAMFHHIMKLLIGQYLYKQKS